MKISFHSHANENQFSYERMSTRTRFEKEANGNSEMAYSCIGSRENKKPLLLGLTVKVRLVSWCLALGSSDQLHQDYCPLI